MIKRSTRVTFIETGDFNVGDIDVNKILASKKEPYGKKKANLNTLLDIMIRTTLDHHV